MRYNDLTISKRYVIHVVYTVLGRTAHSGLHTATQIANCICCPFRHARSERPLEELARRSGRGGSRLGEVDLFSGVAHKYLPQGGIADIKLLEAVLLLDGRHLGEHLAPGSVRRGDPVLQHTLVRVVKLAAVELALHVVGEVLQVVGVVDAVLSQPDGDGVSAAELAFQLVHHADALQLARKQDRDAVAQNLALLHAEQSASSC